MHQTAGGRFRNDESDVIEATAQLRLDSLPEPPIQQPAEQLAPNDFPALPGANAAGSFTAGGWSGGQAAVRGVGLIQDDFPSLGNVARVGRVVVGRVESIGAGVPPAVSSDEAFPALPSSGKSKKHKVPLKAQPRPAVSQTAAARIETNWASTAASTSVMSEVAVVEAAPPIEHLQTVPDLQERP